MITFVDKVNQALTSLFDLLLAPFSSLAPIWGLTIISLISGVILILIYGKISFQSSIANAKRKIYSSLLESVLYRHDLKTSLRAQLGMFGQGCVYFLLAVPPILILAIPTLLILAQLNLNYNSRGIKADESLIISAKVASNEDLYRTTLTAPTGFEITPPLRINDGNEIWWKLTAKPGSQGRLELSTGEQKFSYPITLAEQKGPIIAFSSTNWLWNILYPGENPLITAPSVITELSLSYPEQSYKFLGMNTHWLVAFLLLSIISGIIASKIFGIEI